MCQPLFPSIPGPVASACISCRIRAVVQDLYKAFFAPLVLIHCRIAGRRRGWHAKNKRTTLISTGVVHYLASGLRCAGVLVDSPHIAPDAFVYSYLCPLLILCA